MPTPSYNVSDPATFNAIPDSATFNTVEVWDESGWLFSFDSTRLPVLALDDILCCVPDGYTVNFTDHGDYWRDIGRTWESDGSAASLAMLDSMHVYA